MNIALKIPRAMSVLIDSSNVEVEVEVEVGAPAEGSPSFPPTACFWPFSLSLSPIANKTLLFGLQDATRYKL